MEKSTPEQQISFMRILTRRGYSAEQLFDIISAFDELVKNNTVGE